MQSLRNGIHNKIAVLDIELYMYIIRLKLFIATITRSLAM